MSKNKTAPTLGLDLGDTIIDRSIPVRTPYPDAIRVIERLVREKFGPENVHIISKVNEAQEKSARTWLAQSGFHKLTGIPEANVHFCPERADKAPICERLGITCHIDDRPEVHYHLQDIVEGRFLFRGRLGPGQRDPELEEEARPFLDRLADVTLVHTWIQVEGILLPN